MFIKAARFIEINVFVFMCAALIKIIVYVITYAVFVVLEIIVVNLIITVPLPTIIINKSHKNYSQFPNIVEKIKMFKYLLFNLLLVKPI